MIISQINNIYTLLQITIKESTLMEKIKYHLGFYFPIYVLPDKRTMKYRIAFGKLHLKIDENECSLRVKDFNLHTLTQCLTKLGVDYGV